jgi:hypothetical protein
VRTGSAHRWSGRGRDRVAAIGVAWLVACLPAVVRAGGECAAFRQAFDRAQRTVATAPFVDSADEAAEGPRYLETNVTSALQDALAAADPEHPVLGRGDLRYDLGLSNPDNVYYLTRIEPGADYRIVGRRGNSADLTFQVLIGYPGTGTTGTNAGLLRLADLLVDEDGTFVVTVSANSQIGNWLAAAPGADTLVIRETFQDWENERPGSFRLERIGARSLGGHPSRAQLLGALASAAGILETESTFYVRFTAGFLGLIPPGPDNPAPVVLPVNTLTPPVETRNGLPGQRSSVVQFALAADEAMLISVRSSHFPYQGFQVGNIWFESFESALHQTSLTTKQARIDADGVYRFVIAPSDPGVANWLDTRGQLRGFGLMRWQGLDEDLPSDEWPSSEIVKVNELRDRLPLDTPAVSGAARSLELARRAAIVAARLAATAAPVEEFAKRLRALDRATGRGCRPSAFLPGNATNPGPFDL